MRLCTGLVEVDTLRYAASGALGYRALSDGIMLQVFQGLDMENSEKCIIKVLKPVAAKKIKREIKILRNLTGGTAN